jgi:membrane associated rhomboid family serine protease
MSGTGTITLLIILANIILSYRGFQNETFFERLVFGVDKILLQKDYKRLVTSGFVHVGWGHLIFNMLSLFFFSGSVEFFLGPVNYLVIYFASLIGGNLLSLFIHRHHGDYTAAGASGAVCGVIFASIALVPDGSIYLFFFPMPAWLYGLL